MTLRTVRRTWRERLFTRPWRPWRATKQVADSEAFIRYARAARLVDRLPPDHFWVSPASAPAWDYEPTPRRYADITTIGDDKPRLIPTVEIAAGGEPIFKSGGGGDSAGGGASDSWDSPSRSSDSSSSSSSDSSSSDSTSSSSDSSSSSSD